MKNPNVKHFILIALFLALIVQVFNTSSLYIGFSHLADPYKTLAGCFIGISAEFSIFICIYAGSRAAGFWFAVITFFCGILFHNHWPEVQMSFKDNQFYFPTPFLSSTLLQLMNSVLVWFLSELYIQKQEATKVQQSLAQLEQKKAELQNEVIKFTTIKNEVVNSGSEIEVRYTTMKQELLVWEQKRDTIKQEITTLQKKKAGASRGIEHIDQSEA